MSLTGWKSELLTVIRVNIAFTVSVASQFMSATDASFGSPGVHTVRNLQGSPGCGLFYHPESHFCVDKLAVGFSGANWTDSSLERRSTMSQCLFLASYLIS